MKRDEEASLSPRLHRKIGKFSIGGQGKGRDGGTKKVKGDWGGGRTSPWK